MPTTPQGIWYPGSSDAVTPLETTFSTMASSIDNVLAGNVQIHRVDNITQRNALVSQFPPTNANPLFVWRANADNGRELEYTKNGTTWYYVNTSEDDTGWVPVTVASGYTGGSGTSSPAVRRIGNVVYGKGTISGPLTSTPGVTVGTIPSGLAPFSNTYATTATGLTNGGTCRISPGASGDINVIVPSSVTTSVMLSGMIYTV